MFLTLARSAKLRKDLPEEPSATHLAKYRHFTHEAYSSREDDPLARTMRFLLDAVERSGDFL